jgi:hypothetical protein
MTLTAYEVFLAHKAQVESDGGFAPANLPTYLFDYQAALADWAIRKGRSAILADCGLGKTIMELTYADEVARHAGKPVLLLTPLAVAGQIAQEAERFGVDAARSHRGELPSRVVIANYERLHLFRPDDFAGVVCDESSILKSFDGVTRQAVTEFLRTRPYRLLATATAAPNDYIELGTSSEALGHLGYMDMLSRFFASDNKTPFGSRRANEWRLKGHAEQPFWRWVSSWARALRRPSDLGFSDEGFDIPDPVYRTHLVDARSARPGMLFDLPALGFHEEREERRRTIPERCEAVAQLLADTGKPAVAWCQLNDEGDLLERLIPGAVQVSGRDSDEAKEAKFTAFATGEIRVLVTKPSIGAWGLNWQHCAHLTYFPDHSYEQFYQAVRRCWRFGQKETVTVDLVGTPAELAIQENLRRKADQADRMFSELVRHMRDELAIRRTDDYPLPVEVPTWLAS